MKIYEFGFKITREWLEEKLDLPDGQLLSSMQLVGGNDDPVDGFIKLKLMVCELSQQETKISSLPSERYHTWRRTSSTNK